MRVFVLSVVVVGLLGGCGGELRLGPDARLTCEGDADCPAPMTCVEEARRCVLPGVVLDVTPPLFLSVTTSTPRLGAGDRATVTLTFDEEIATAAIAIEADAGDDQPVVPVTIAGSVVTVDVDGATLVSGPLVLTATVTNTAALSLSTRIPTGVTVDVDAPDVVVDEVAIDAAAGNPLFPGRTAAARVDSTVRVDVTWSEGITATGATDVTLTDSAGATATLAVVPVSDGPRTTFSIAPADFAALADGAIDIDLTVTDDVGNSAVRTLPTPLVKDTTPPPAPVFSRLRRTPFGDDTAAVLTEVEGTATDAVVVLAVPAGVTVGPLVVPAHVARIVPAAADGALALGVEIDVPAMRLVAVDAAGNLGPAASAQTTDLVASTAIGASPHQIMARPVVADSLQQRGDTRVDPLLRDAAGAGVTTTSVPFWRPLTTPNAVRVNGNVLMARDPIGGGVIVFGDGETFRLRGSHVERLDVPPLVVQQGAAMATDERRGRIVLFGGAQRTELASAVVRNDLFEWDGTRWLHILQHDPAATDRPSPRVGHGAGYVEAEGGVVIVNGCGEDTLSFAGCATQLQPEVWVWDGARFTRRCSGLSCGDAPLPVRPEIIVDTDGVMVATGGTFGGPIAIGPDPPPALKRFVNGTFVSRCAGDCARSIPFDGLAHVDAATGAPAFLGTCDTGLCLVTVRADDTTTTTLLTSDRGMPDADIRLQARGVVVDGDQLLVSEQTIDGSRILVARDGQFGQLFPTSLVPRCGGAIAVVDDETRVLGGCAVCPLKPAQEQCTTPVTAVEAPLSPRPSRGTGPVGGNTIAVPGDDDTAILTWQLVDNAGSMDVRRASDLTTVQTFALGDKRSVAAALSPGNDDRIVIVGTVTDLDQFPPFFAIVEPIQVLDLGASSPVLGAGCTANCALNRSTGNGVAAAPTRGGKGVLFGGTLGGLIDVVDATVVMDELGQGTSLDPAIRPFPRQGAMAAFDAQRELTWLAGGTTAGEFTTGDGTRCGGPGSATECNDLWTFDGATWTEVRPVDILGVGVPPARYRGQIAVVDGRVVLTGGSIGAPRNARSLGDGWVLEASTLTPPSHQLAATLAAYGADADQTFSGLLARWCGVARDGTGAAVPVTLRAFAGGRWRTMASTVDEAGCVDGELDLDGIADVVVREPGHGLVVEVVPVLTTPGRDAPRLTTTVLTLTGRYTAAP